MGRQEANANTETCALRISNILGHKLGNLWFWFGTQGYEYVDLGRFWQIVLFVGLSF